MPDKCKKLERELNFINFRLQGLIRRRDDILESMTENVCPEDLSPEAIRRNQELLEKLKIEMGQ